MEREILHLAVPSFSLQVLAGNKKRFSGQPMVLSGVDSDSARVLSLNPKAFSEGIRRGMILASARRYCSKLEVYTPLPSLFHRADQEVFKFLGNWTPVIEQAKSGFYLDLTGTAKLFGKGADSGNRILRDLEKRFELISSVGIGINKLVGKMASGVISAPSLAQVLPLEESDFLGPFPVKKVLGETGLVNQLEDLGLALVSDLQRFSLAELCSSFGPDGNRLHLLAQGIDFSPVVPCDSAAELSEGESLAQASNDFDHLCVLLFRLCHRLGRELRRMKKRAGFLRLFLVYRDGKRYERKANLKRPSAFDHELFQHSRKLLESAFSRRVLLIYLGLRASRFASGYQPELFGETDGTQRLYLALDQIQKRYGDQAVRFGIEGC